MKRSIDQYRRLANLIIKQVALSGKPFLTSQTEDSQTEILFVVTYTSYRFLKYDKIKGIIIEQPNNKEKEIIENLRKELG